MSQKFNEVFNLLNVYYHSSLECQVLKQKNEQIINPETASRIQFSSFEIYKYFYERKICSREVLGLEKSPIIIDN